MGNHGDLATCYSLQACLGVILCTQEAMSTISYSVKITLPVISEIQIWLEMEHKQWGKVIQCRLLFREVIGMVKEEPKEEPGDRNWSSSSPVDVSRCLGGNPFLHHQGGAGQ